MTDSLLHPAFAADTDWLVCADPRCATVLPQDAEVCDECGGTRLERLRDLAGVLCAWDEARPVAFALRHGQAAVIGRSTAGATVDIDLSRLPGSGTVHRRHALIEGGTGEWRVTHLGTNPLVVNGRDPLASGEARLLRPGDTLDVAGVRLQLVVHSSDSTG